MTTCAVNSEANDPSDLKSPSTVPCKLFSDLVSKKVCELRKKELDLSGAFSCAGCPTDAIMRKPQKNAQGNDGRLRD
jgi:hypothetical protein